MRRSQDADSRCNSIEGKMEQIKTYQEEHNIVGVSFSTKPNAKIKPVDATDYVLEVMKKSVALCEDKQSIPLAD